MITAKQWVGIVIGVVLGFFFWFGVVRAQLTQGVFIEERQASSTPAFLMEATVPEQETYAQNQQIIYELRAINSQLQALRKKI